MQERDRLSADVLRSEREHEQGTAQIREQNRDLRTKVEKLKLKVEELTDSLASSEVGRGGG